MQVLDIIGQTYACREGSAGAKAHIHTLRDEQQKNVKAGRGH
ncbi:hypothetical protein Hsw_PA0057 (plasmid) [Hymenobacter swuensis DY53]|uniref:Uncharacterized protein n=1 Tax=Hymenobacter swuensis DY53 TaxID=1227739 RepID=W8F0J6_9BACT|nr:hypothetical protein Hsw_PA0057 [Hymenobacter swuensis DY53]